MSKGTPRSRRDGSLQRVEWTMATPAPAAIAPSPVILRGEDHGVALNVKVAWLRSRRFPLHRLGTARRDHALPAHARAAPGFFGHALQQFRRKVFGGAPAWPLVAVSRGDLALVGTATQRAGFGAEVHGGNTHIAASAWASLHFHPPRFKARVSRNSACRRILPAWMLIAELMRRS